MLNFPFPTLTLHYWDKVTFLPKRYGEISSDFFLERNDKKSTQKGETVQILPPVLDRQMGHKLMLVRHPFKTLEKKLKIDHSNLNVTFFLDSQYYQKRFKFDQRHSTDTTMK